MSELDLSEFDAEGRPKGRCWYQRLDPEQREKVNAAHERGYAHPVIAKVVTNWGFPIKRTSVSVHYRKQCACE